MTNGMDSVGPAQIQGSLHEKPLVFQGRAETEEAHTIYLEPTFSSL